jgi:hypothetical protein
LHPITSLPFPLPGMATRIQPEKVLTADGRQAADPYLFVGFIYKY